MTEDLTPGQSHQEEHCQELPIEGIMKNLQEDLSSHPETTNPTTNLPEMAGIRLTEWDHRHQGGWVSPLREEWDHLHPEE